VKTRRFNLPRRGASFGLSLIEIMVGVAIGLIGIVSIFQAVAVWTKHTQSTSSGGDAQVAGTLALFNIERDIKQAGHGFGVAGTPVMGCLVSVTDSGPLGRPPFTFGLRPVDIAAGAGGAPDKITVLYGNSSFFVDEEKFDSATAISMKLQRRGGFKLGDLAVIAVNPAASAATATCQLIEITDDTNTDGYSVGHTDLPYASYYNGASAPVVTPRFNNPASAPLAAAGAMYNLGPQPILNTWSIESNRLLTKTEGLQIQTTAPMQIAEGVINLKAEYGYDTNGNGEIDDSATNHEWLTTLPAGADWRRVLAVRVAVLVRSRQFERSGDPSASAVWAVTPSASNPYYFGDPVNRKFLMTNIDGSPGNTLSDTDAIPNNWRYYRYRVYERIIPLRNVLWGTLS
jgi:type IV pilus assembly protein PilW